ncbi:hypothetical protein LJC16_00945 [Bacteroidales bacterium OttesenSCG-928-C19]|nr:hypothetical protein [Bacteroidales bacterium OttesenSCG-928-C19]
MKKREQTTCSDLLFPEDSSGVERGRIQNSEEEVFVLSMFSSSNGSLRYLGVVCAKLTQKYKETG